MRKTLITLSLLALFAFAISSTTVSDEDYDFEDDNGCEGNDVDSCSKSKPTTLTTLNCCYMKAKVDDKDANGCVAVKKDKDVISDLKDQFDDKKTMKIKSIDCGAQFINFSVVIFVIFTLF